MDPHELLMTALRAVAVYVLMLAVLRLLGKRTVGNFTAFDLLVALMLGEVVDEVIYGDVAMVQGFMAIAVIAGAHYSNSWLSYWDHGLLRVLEGAPTPIVERGELKRDGLRRERMNERDALAELRLRGLQDVREVRLAQVEVDGQVSVIREGWAEPVQRADVFPEAAAQRDRARPDGGGRGRVGEGG
jgi:uncharacterized membrane protein YcaP (DUF421 family)